MGNFKENLISFALIAGAAVGAVGIASAVHQFNEAAHPPSEGQEYLVQQGYKDVEGGKYSWFNGCGKNVFAREYTVTNPKTGETEARTVCFSPLFGKHGPLIGK
ncbi:MAG: hypothetical protein ACAH80_07550 [Alphaproteobacteria bacterium]